MRNLILSIAACTMLFACNNTSTENADSDDMSEEVVIAKNSAWSTQHLAGMPKMIEEINYTADSTGAIGEQDSCCAEYTYFDDRGYLEKYVEKNSEGEVVYERTMKFGDEGHFMSSNSTENGEPYGSRQVTRDENNKLIHAIDLDGSGALKYYYDQVVENELGQALSGTMYNGDSVYLGKWGRKYTDGMMTGRSWEDSTGLVLYDYSGTVNDKGLLSKMNGVLAAGPDSTTTTVSTFEYGSFDEKGNWTERTESEDGVVKEVKRRSYTY